MRLYLIVLVLGAIVQSAPAAAIINYVGDENNVGMAGPVHYGMDVYDLYSTTASSTSTGTSSTSSFGAGARITKLPAYIASITATGVNTSAAGYPTYAIIDNPAGGTIKSGFTFIRNTSPTEQNMLQVAVGTSPPSTFFVGAMTNIDPSDEDYPNALRLKSVLGGSGADSGLINTTNNASGEVDFYFFEVRGAPQGDVLNLSGVEADAFPDGIHLAISGLVFSSTNPVPEPASLSLLLLGGISLLNRRRCAV